MGKVDDIDYNILSQIFEKINGMDIIQNAMFSKVNELVENSKVEKKEEEEEEDKEAHKQKLNEIFEKRRIGRPVGDYNSKQLQYFELVKTGKIKSPVAKTLDYYQITRDENNEWIMNVLPK